MGGEPSGVFFGPFTFQSGRKPEILNFQGGKNFALATFVPDSYTNFSLGVRAALA
jgi:hypothetical protein